MSYFLPLKKYHCLKNSSAGSCCPYTCTYSRTFQSVMPIYLAWNSERQNMLGKWRRFKSCWIMHSMGPQKNSKIFLVRTFNMANFFKHCIVLKNSIFQCCFYFNFLYNSWKFANPIKSGMDSTLISRWIWWMNNDIDRMEIYPMRKKLATMTAQRELTVSSWWPKWSQPAVTEPWSPWLSHDWAVT